MDYPALAIYRNVVALLVWRPPFHSRMVPGAWSVDSNARLRTVHRQLAADRFPPRYGAAIVT